MAPDDDAPRTTLDSIATQIAASVGSVADEVLRLSVTTATMLRRYEQDRARARQFIDHFGVGSILADHPSGRGVQESIGTRIDYRVVRRDFDALDDSIRRGQLLHGRLMASHRVLRELRESFSDGDGEDGHGSPGDVRLQQATLAAREDERGRLAREMHDGPAQVFANAIFALEIAEQVARRDPDRVPEELSRLRVLLKDGVAEMRRFMTDLRPAMLTDRGLVSALRHYVTEYNRFFDKLITFTATDVPENLTSEQELALFRIVQEGLQNLYKHAGTRVGAITIRQDPAEEMLVLTIVDDGNGFDPELEAIDAGHGVGLTGMRERAWLLGADIDVRSAPGAGTTIRVALPVPVRLPTARTVEPINGRFS